MSEQIIEIPIERIKPSPFNPRRSLPDIVSLKASIDSAGILEPLIVRPLSISVDVVGGSHAGFETRDYEMVDGHRRLAAACDRATVPCVVRDLTDDQAKQVQLVTALQREGLHPYDEAVIIGNLLDSYSGQAAEVGKIIGKHVTYVRRRAVLLKLIPPVAALFKENKLSIETALLLARTIPETQSAIVAAAKEQKRDLAPQFVEWFSRQRFNNLKEAPWGLDDPNIFPEAGPCTTCPKQSNNQTALFDVKDEKNLCLDMACFKQKLANFLNAKRQDEPETILVREGHMPRGMDELGPDKYIFPTDKKLKCDSLKPALLIDGGYKKTSVCTDPKCKVHSVAKMVATPERKAELAKGRQTRAIGVEMFRDILDSRGDGLRDEDLRTIAEFTWERMWHDSKGHYFKHLGVGKDYDMDTAIAKSNRNNLMNLLLAFSLVPLIDPRQAESAVAKFQKVFKDRLDMAEIKKRVSAPKAKTQEGNGAPTSTKKKAAKKKKRK